MKRWIAVLLTLVLALAMLPVSAEEGEAYFADWNPDAPALKALIEYVEDVTDEASANYIPVGDRIATFDMDGTLCAELYPTYLEYYMLARRIFCDPSYRPDEEMLEFGRMLRDHAPDKSFPEGMDVLHATHAAKAYAGMSLTQFNDFVTVQLVREADGFEGMTYANSFYLPMIEVVEYLQDHDFKVYVVSGSDRFLCRTFIEGVLDIPYEQIIGMDVDVEAANEDGVDGLKYVYTKDDCIIRTDRLLIKNLKMNKVKAIVKEIGRQPVLSFGNTSGDVSMHNYTIFNNRYRSAAFMLIADDETRDYGNTEKAQPLRKQWEESGYHVISMKDDFRTIYGDDVRKTGAFRWMEEFADPNAAADKPAAETAAAESSQAPGPEAEEKKDVQYVLFLGTNDKDTNKPVFTQAEALEKAKEILIRHFGGYTIQEAHGGWVDNGTVYQEYTLVIYLSDTTLDLVHEAAAEMVDTFRQSSVLIQANETQTEFYAP
ncbi:MAG: haloacid dehalogenase-like hydrolase [Clostridia bacterium]|nr:haloacid dehalogenase-like hydrolase [Clostridia bacterium]